MRMLRLSGWGRIGPADVDLFAVILSDKTNDLQNDLFFSLNRSKINRPGSRSRNCCNGTEL